MKIPAPLALLATLLGVFSGCAEGEAVTRPPNILLITIDTFRADRMGCYGNAGEHTPRMDELARRGTIFDHALAPMATTFPSHATLFTGVAPVDHDVRWNGDALDESWTTIAEHLSDVGYDTGAFVTYKSMVTRGGLGQGFQEKSDEQFTGKHSDTRPGSEVNEYARGWISRRTDRPFFAWVHYFDPHTPLEPTPYAEREMRDYDGFLKDGASVELFYGERDTIAADPDHRRAVNALYDGTVRQVDELVGELVDALDRFGHADDTVIVLTADHGQSLGDHGVMGHGAMLWDVVLRVPLILVDPRSPKDGLRVEERVGLEDLAPTLLELAGVEPPEQLRGRSLLAATGGEPLAARPYFAEIQRARGAPDPDPDVAPVAIFDGRFKYVRHKGATLVYDILSDPREERPLMPSLNVLERYAELAGTYHRRSRGRGSNARDVDPQVVDELQALGYLGQDE